MRSTVLKAIFAVLVLCAGGCSNPVQPGDQNPSNGGDQGDSTGGNHDSTWVTVAVDGVKLTPQTFQFAGIGEVTQLVATVSPANATDKAVTWESTEPAVAPVDSVGRVTARAAGAGVFITVITHDGHRQASANVTVNP